MVDTAGIVGKERHLVPGASLIPYALKEAISQGNSPSNPPESSAYPFGSAGSAGESGAKGAVPKGGGSETRPKPRSPLALNRGF